MTERDIVMLTIGATIGLLIGAVISYRAIVSVNRLADPIWKRMYDVARAEIERIESDPANWQRRAQIALACHSLALEEIAELKQHIEDLKRDHTAALESMGAN